MIAVDTSSYTQFPNGCRHFRSQGTLPLRQKLPLTKVPTTFFKNILRCKSSYEERLYTFYAMNNELCNSPTLVAARR